MKNDYHLINGLPCTNKECWCHVYLEELDVVNHPGHYMLNLDSGQEVEVLQIIKSILSPEEYKGYLIGNITKYVLRHKSKNKDEDLQKLAFYTKELDTVL